MHQINLSNMKLKELYIQIKPRGISLEETTKSRDNGTTFRDWETSSKVMLNSTQLYSQLMQDHQHQLVNSLIISERQARQFSKECREFINFATIWYRFYQTGDLRTTTSQQWSGRSLVSYAKLKFRCWEFNQEMKIKRGWKWREELLLPVFITLVRWFTLMSWGF